MNLWLRELIESHDAECSFTCLCLEVRDFLTFLALVDIPQQQLARGRATPAGRGMRRDEYLLRYSIKTLCLPCTRESTWIHEVN